MDLSRDGRALLLGAPDATVHVVDLSQPPVAGQPMPELSSYSWGHTDRVIGAAFSPDGRLVASASLDGKVILWNVATGEVARVMKHEAGLEQMMFSPDGSKLFSQAGPVYAVGSRRSERAAAQVGSLDAGAGDGDVTRRNAAGTSGW